jgi:hypothetical protein
MTALIGSEPHLILGHKNKEYILEDQQGNHITIDMEIPLNVLPKSENNALVAATRLDSPFKIGSTIGD